jgi:hypothetical protein
VVRKSVALFSVLVTANPVSELGSLNDYPHQLATPARLIITN